MEALSLSLSLCFERAEQASCRGIQMHCLVASLARELRAFNKSLCSWSNEFSRKELTPIDARSWRCADHPARFSRERQEHGTRRARKEDRSSNHEPK